MSEADFQPLLEWLKLNPNWLLFSIFFISFIESLALAGIIVPGVLMLFLVASVAGHLDYAISSILVCGFLGAILGDGVSFYLGRHFKDSIPKLWPFSRYPDTLVMGETFFYKHGGKSVTRITFNRGHVRYVTNTFRSIQQRFSPYLGSFLLTSGLPHR
jgi:membrane protein DedA with SNARE-associated domain